MWVLSLICFMIAAGTLIGYVAHVYIIRPWRNARNVRNAQATSKSAPADPFRLVRQLSTEDYGRLNRLKAELTPLARLCAREPAIVFIACDAERIGVPVVVIQSGDSELIHFMAGFLRRCGYTLHVSLTDPKHSAQPRNVIEVLLVPTPNAS